MISKKIGLLIGIIFTLSGSILNYLEGYKDNELLDDASFFLMLIGWVTIIWSLFGNKTLMDNNFVFKEQKLGWLRDKLTRFIIYFSFVILMILNCIYVTELGNNRVSYILNNEPTNITTAKVINIERRTSRRGSTLWAIIQYKSDGKIIEKSIPNFSEKYSVGQLYSAKYSIGHPDMFELIDLITNQ